MCFAQLIVANGDVRRFLALRLLHSTVNREFPHKTVAFPANRVEREFFKQTIHANQMKRAEVNIHAIFAINVKEVEKGRWSTLEEKKN